MKYYPFIKQANENVRQVCKRELKTKSGGNAAYTCMTISLHFSEDPI